MLQLKRTTRENVGTPAPTLVHTQRQPAPSVRKAVEVAEMTGPLMPLFNRKALVLADVENLSYSARDVGFKVSYAKLGEKLHQLTHSCALHAFFSRQPGAEARVRYFEERGWIAHPRDIEIAHTYHGTRRFANSDHWIAFYAGVLSSRSAADLVVIASGDGSMVCDLAKALEQLPKPREVVTLSIAGSTSWRLDARKNRSITENIEIGQDCLRPITARKEETHELPQQPPEEPRSRGKLHGLLRAAFSKP